MKCSSSSMDLLLSLYTALSMIAAACSSAPPLTKEELALQRRFDRTLIPVHSWARPATAYDTRPPDARQMLAASRDSFLEAFSGTPGQPGERFHLESIKQ